MPVKIYKKDTSPPARSVMMACEIYGIPAEMIDVNLAGAEHKTPQFLKLNPLHTIPVFQDGDFVLHDSQAILMYLADTYGKDDSWYPKNLKQRALVNQKLFFNESTLFRRLRNITYYVIIEGVKVVNQRLYDDVEEAYGFLEEFLSRSRYLAGEHMTIADIAAIASVTSLMVIHPHDGKKYPKTLAWVKEMEKLPFCQKYNAPGTVMLEKLFNEKLKG